MTRQVPADGKLPPDEGVLLRSAVSFPRPLPHREYPSFCGSIKGEDLLCPKSIKNHGPGVPSHRAGDRPVPLSLHRDPHHEDWFRLRAIAVCAMLYGPVLAAPPETGRPGGGAILFPIGPYFPGFTLSAVLTGVVFGVFLFHRENKWRTSLPRCASTA
jgi:hypothetical protein